MQETAAARWTGLKDMPAQVSAATTTATGVIQGLVGLATNAITSAATQLKKTVTSAANYAKDVVSGAFTNVQNGLLSITSIVTPPPTPTLTPSQPFICTVPTSTRLPNGPPLSSSTPAAPNYQNIQISTNIPKISSEQDYSYYARTVTSTVTSTSTKPAFKLPNVCFELSSNPSQIDWTEVVIDSVGFLCSLVATGILPTGQLHISTGVDIVGSIAEAAGFGKLVTDVISGDEDAKYGIMIFDTNYSYKTIVKVVARGERLIPWVGMAGNIVSLGINLETQIYIDEEPVMPWEE